MRVPWRNPGKGVRILALIAGLVWAGPSAAAAQEPLRVALLPILDAFPFYVAESEGFFSDEGVAVKALVVNSGVERDQLMQAGEIDAMLNEMMTTANFNREAVQVQIVCLARQAMDQAPMFRVLASPDSGLQRVAQLKGVPVGISKNTIIEYVTDRLLAAAGLNERQIRKQSVPVIPERYQLLLSGQLKAAVLPDPLGKSALAAGAVTLVDDGQYPFYSASVLSFHVNAATKRNESVRRFVRGWDRAVKALNRNPDDYRSLMQKSVRIPPNIQQSFTVPRYPRAGLPSPEQWEDMMQWMQAKGLTGAPLPYEPSITRQFIP
jgi:NitT/TauT family transport system substrate-binding protein